MKKLFAPLIFFTILFFCAHKTNAQQASDTTIVAGHFEMDTVIGSDTNHINVNYSLSSLPFVYNIHMNLHTPNITLFNADIVDGSGTVYTTWTPTTLSNLYDNDFDISALSSGSYYINIRKNNTSTVLYAIAFTK